jgi:hypothetical protein
MPPKVNEDIPSLPDKASANIYITAGTRDSRDTRAGVEVALDRNARKKSHVGKLIRKLFRG